MDFSLSEEQVLLQDSVAKFVSDHCDVDRHRRLLDTPLGFDPQAWQQFADLGWLAVPFSEELGGIGGSAVDVMVMCEALGRAPVREPYLATVISCGGFLRRGASPSQQQRFIGPLIEGGSQWAFAFAEPGSGYKLTQVGATAAVSGDGYRLSGEKIAVLNGHCADFLVVTARTSGEPGEEQGLSLFVVDAGLPGIERDAFTAVDGSRGASLRFDSVVLDSDCLLGEKDKALPLIEAVLDESILAMGAEAVGAMQSLLDATVEYTRTREQFGQPIGKFQALQHRMADMYLKLEETRSLLFNAAIELQQEGAGAAAACSALKVKLAEAGRFVSQQAVQLHGGIGMTDELVIGHHFKRLLLLSKLYGDEAWHLQRYADITRPTDSAASG